MVQKSLLMKKIFLLVVFALSLISNAKSQDVLGYINSNYSGVTGIDINPANVVDTRYKVDINLIGISFSAYNNYLGIHRDVFKMKDSYGHLYAFDNLFQDKYISERGNKMNKSVYFSNQIYTPSFLITINKKNAFAIKTKVRTLLNVDGIEPDLAKLLYKSVNYPTLWTKLSNQNLSIQTMTWAEYGASFGHVFKDEGKHFFKAGVTVNYLQGIQSAYMNVKNLDYKFSNDTTLSLYHTDVSYGHSTNFEADKNNIKFKQIANASFGLDLGFVYEWRPDFEKYKYDMDGKTGLTRKDKNKYKLKVGVSIVDIGAIKFKKGEYSHNFTANIDNWNLHQFDTVKTIADFDKTLKSNFVMQDGDQYYKMNLPMAITAQIDYNIYKDLYINFTPYWSPRMKNDMEKVHDLTTFSLTPRWDHKWFGVFLPFSYDNTGNFKAGVALRMGPIIIGTNSLGPWVNKGDIYGADAFVLLKIPIMYNRPRDKDKDKVSDRKDKCKDIPGTWELMGCPDKDGDKIQDKDDACPDEPGLPKFNGCPDKDGDGIIDKKDACPDVAGLPEFNGCPDKDGDKIIDKDDDCPDVAGLPQFKGCPDRDGDGVMDKIDNCPDKPGPASNNGCPEVKLNLINSLGNSLKSATQAKDGSFTFDNLPADNTVIFKLEGENTEGVEEVKVIVNGIAKKAIRDTKDHYFRFADENKDFAVKLNKEEAEVLKKAFNNLEFATAKDIIKDESFASLDELFGLMTKKPLWRLKISGHTDNQGDNSKNMKLSEKRAKAVQNYLVSKGISADRFKVEWFGSTKPIADNKTEIGRQKNRRVEMLIIE